MKNYDITKFILCFACILVFNCGNSQEKTWGAYSKYFDTKGYEGHQFRLSAMVKTNIFHPAYLHETYWHHFLKFI